MILAFYSGWTVSLKPVWSLIEKSRITDVTSLTPEYFPVLVHSTDDEREFTSRYLSNTTFQPVVEGITKDVLPKINADLRSLISTNSFKHDYFVIMEQNPVYTDVMLEVPTLHDSMSKSWYRIQDGKIIPQKSVRYGPGFAFLVIPWTFFSGLLAAVIAMITIRKIWPNINMERDS